MLSLDVSVSCRQQNVSGEFHTKNRYKSPAISSVSIRHPFEPNGERQAILWLELVTPLGAIAQGWLAQDCLL